GVRRVASGHRPLVRELAVAVLGERRTGPEVLPEPLVGAAVLLAERPRADAELGQVARLEERGARVRREPAEDVRAEHRGDHGAIPAARLAGDPAMLAGRHRAVPRV